MHGPIDGKFKGRLWLEKGDRTLLGRGRLELISRIQDLGSINQAAKSMGMSYKAAWEIVRSMNALANEPIVETSRGGTRGGETRLTGYGKELVEMFGLFQKTHERFLEALSRRLQRGRFVEDPEHRMATLTSVPNQFWGIVLSVKPEGLVTSVAISTHSGIGIIARVLTQSVARLNLGERVEVCVSILPALIALRPISGSPTGSRPNRFQCTVTRCVVGAATGQVELDLLDGGHRWIAEVPSSSIHAMKLGGGAPVYAEIESSHVILGVDG